nr:hypothetical protein BaRGS_008215 [Batillaria attramentaria]
MATRGTPTEFVLAPNQLKKEATTKTHDPKVQRERMNMFKRQLAANRKKHEDAQRRDKAGPQPVHTVSSSTARSVVEALKEQCLAEGREGKEGREGGAEDHDEIDAAQISSEDWPFIYFVVALDQMPVAREDMDEYRVGKPHTARERQRFLAARKRRIQQSREEMERIREANIDMGLRLEPIRPPSRPQGVHIHHPAAQTTLLASNIFWSLYPGFCSLYPGFWSLYPGFCSLCLGFCSLYPGFWSLYPGFWSLYPGFWSL